MKPFNHKAFYLILIIWQVLGVLAQIKADKDSVEVLVQPVETADKIFHDIQAQQNEVDDLEAKFDIQGQDTKSMEDIQAEINTLQKKMYYILNLFV